jgi:hypothetical protein
LLRNDKRITGLFSARDLQKNYANKDSVENIPKINKTTTDRLLNDPKAEEIFNMFPALKTDLEDVVKKENLLQSVLDENSVVIKRAQSKHAFAKLKNMESPERFISTVISSEEPIKNLNKVLQDIRSFNKGTANEQIIKLQDEDKLPNLTFEKVITSAQGIQRNVTEQITTETMEQGLRESIMGYVLTKAGLEGSGPFNPNTAFTLLFKPMKGVGGRARQSLATWMRSNRLITEQELDTFREVLGNMNKLQAQERAGTLDINSPENAFTDFYLRVTGSALGQKMQRVLVPGQVTAGGLVAETAGSKLVRRFFQAMPESLRQDALLEVMSKPAYMAQLMRDVKDEKVALSVVDFLRRKFKEAVLITTTGQLRRTAPAVKEEDVPLTDIIKEDQEQREMKRPDRASVDLPKAGFPTTQTAMIPPSGLNTRLAANVGAVPQAAPNPNQRQQFASLFPNDPISGLINAQQPPRLMAEGGAVPPRQVDIQGQPHMLAYITPQEGGILQLLGGSGAPGPMGIPSFAFGDPDAGADESQPGGPSDDGSDNNNENYGSYADDTSGYSTVGIDSSYSPSVGGDTGYSGSITSAMADTSPTGMTGIGGIGGGSGGFGVTSTGMGLDDLGIADQVGIMGGLSGGVSDLQTMQGSSSYAPVTNVPYDIFGFVKGAMNRHARDSLRKGYSPEFTYDEKGRITSVTGKGGPGVSIPGVGGLMSMIGANMGGITTTGYDPSVIGGSGGDDNGGGIATLPTAPISPTQAKKTDTGIVSPLDIYLANVDKYRVRGM